jgi:hypothetical protein
MPKIALIVCAESWNFCATWHSIRKCSFVTGIFIVGKILKVCGMVYYYNYCVLGHYPSLCSLFETRSVSETLSCLDPQIKACSFGHNRSSETLFCLDPQIKACSFGHNRFSETLFWLHSQIKACSFGHSRSLETLFCLDPQIKGCSFGHTQFSETLFCLDPQIKGRSFGHNRFSETLFWLHSQIKAAPLGTIVTVSPYLRTPAPTQDRIHKPNTKWRKLL